MRASCVNCHGVDGVGAGQEPAIPSLVDAKWLRQDENALRAAIADPAHPQTADLDAAEVALASLASRRFTLGFDQQTVRAEGDGVITVRLRNGTTGQALGPLAISLLLFDGENLVAEHQATADADGVAAFDGLPTDPSWAFVAEAKYQGIPFNSEMQQFEPTAAALEFPLEVYDPGGNKEDVSITRAHWVVNLETPDRLDVAELYVFDNTSKRVYEGEHKGPGDKPLVLALFMPPEATDVSFEGGELGDRFLEVNGATYDTLPLAPGQRQVLLRYSLPVSDGRAALSHPVAYPIAALNLLAPDLGMDIEAADWQVGDKLQTPSGDYLNYSLTNIAADASPNVIFDGISADRLTRIAPVDEAHRQIVDPSATPGISGQPYLPFVVVGLGIAILGLGILWVSRRQRALQVQQPALRQAQHQALIQQIADLDDAYEAGEMSEAEYRAQRQMLKSRLVILMREDGA